MLPDIIELVEGRIVVSANAWGIPELRAIMDKHEPNAEPYLHYVHAHTHPRSAYINIPPEEKEEQIQYDLVITYGNFDTADELILPAINRMINFYTTPLRRYVDELERELGRQTTYISTTPLSADDLKIRQDMLKSAGVLIKSYKQMQKEADEELQQKLRGSAKTGRY